MKAIYINLDPFIADARGYIAGDTATPPVFQDQLPLAVTVPAGQSAALVCQTEATVDGGTQPVPFATWTATVGGDSILSNALSSDFAPAMSGEFVTETASVYAVPATAKEVNITVTLTDGADENPKTVALPAFTVLVRRETASGPVDLVDFTPPLTATQINAALGGTGAAEGQPLKGVSLASATNAPAPTAADIKSILVAAGDEALAGVRLGGSVIIDKNAGGATTPTKYLFDALDNPFDVMSSPDSLESAIGFG